MFDSMISAVTDFVRGFLYGIAGAFMFVLDIIWEAIHKLVSLDLSDYLDNWFLLIMTLVGFFMLLRVGKIAMKIFFDEEYRMKFSFSNLMIKFFLASVMITMLPYAFSFCNKAMITMIDNMSAFIPYTATVTEETPGPSTGNDIADQFIDAFISWSGAFENAGSPNSIDDLKPSTVMLQIGRINMNNVDDDLAPIIDATSDDFDINEKSDGNYIYFSTWSSLFLLIVESILCAFIFVLIGVTIGKRLFDIALKYLMAPYVVAASIEPDDRTFGLWTKLMIADWITNFVQLYAVYFVLYLCNNTTILGMLGNDAIGIIAQIFLFIAGLMAAMSVPQTISTIIGGYGAGTGQALSDLRTGFGLVAGTSGAIAGVTSGIVGGGLGAVGGAISGATRSYRSSEGSIGKTIGGGFFGGLAGAGSALKTNFTGGKISGGATRGGQILISGISSLFPHSKSGSSGSSRSMSSNDYSSTGIADAAVEEQSPSSGFVNSSGSEILADVPYSNISDISSDIVGSNYYAEPNIQDRDVLVENGYTQQQINTMNQGDAKQKISKMRNVRNASGGINEGRSSDINPQQRRRNGLLRSRRSREISPDNDLDFYINSRNNRLG